MIELKTQLMEKSRLHVLTLYEPRRKKTGVLPMRKQRRRSASQ